MNKTQLFLDNNVINGHRKKYIIIIIFGLKRQFFQASFVSAISASIDFPAFFFFFFAAFRDAEVAKRNLRYLKDYTLNWFISVFLLQC
jgi:hypothetical protein